MKIDTSVFQMQASHSAASVQSTASRLNVWVGDRPSTGLRDGRTAGSAAAQHSLTLSQAALTASQTDAVASAPPTDDNDPKLQLIRSIIELLTGQTIHTLSASDLSPPSMAAGAGHSATAAPATTPTTPAKAGIGVEFDAHTVVEESEQTQFTAQAVVHTADGRQISVAISLQMSRSYREETNVSLRLGDAVKKDPLVINFGGTAAQLQSQRFAFDLNGDGTAENVPLLTGHSGYLALDLNHNGRIDSGRELFGPATGQGFAELARYDQDGNGWIDESDAVFTQLQVWTPEAGGNGQLQSAQALGVGALYLGATATPFELRDASNRSLGTVRSTGAYLMENGNSGTLQQIDLTA